MAAVSGSVVGSYTYTLTQYIGGNYVNTAGGQSNSTFTSTASDIGATFGTAGDKLVGHFSDNSTGHIYEVCWFAGPTGPGSGYATIIADRIV